MMSSMFPKNVCQAHRAPCNNEITVVQTGSVECDQNLVWAEVAGGRDGYVLLILKGLFEAILVVDHPLSAHVER